MEWNGIGLNGLENGRPHSLSALASSHTTRAQTTSTTATTASLATVDGILVLPKEQHTHTHTLLPLGRPSLCISSYSTSLISEHLSNYQVTFIHSSRELALSPSPITLIRSLQFEQQQQQHTVNLAPANALLAGRERSLPLSSTMAIAMAKPFSLTLLAPAIRSGRFIRSA